MWSFRNALVSCASTLSKLAIDAEKCSSIIRPISTCSTLEAWRNNNNPTKFIRHNKTIFPPQAPDETPRLAYVCHQKTNIKYSPKKMWYIASFVRGMSVDEAIKQLAFLDKKGAFYVRETILEAQKLAVENHNVEFKSNLWIPESFAGKGAVIKGLRRHARGRMGKVEYRYCHYFVRLEEGAPPEKFYKLHEKTPDEMLENWLENMRKRKIYRSF